MDPLETNSDSDVEIFLKNCRLSSDRLSRYRSMYENWYDCGPIGQCWIIAPATSQRTKRSVLIIITTTTSRIRDNRGSEFN